MNIIYIILILKFVILVVTIPYIPAFMTSAGTTSTLVVSVANSIIMNITIAITNSYRKQLFLFFGVNSGYLTLLGDP
jgi:hypothetical protein